MPAQAPTDSHSPRVRTQNGYILCLPRPSAVRVVFPPFTARVVELVDTQVSEACA